MLQRAPIRRGPPYQSQDLSQLFWYLLLFDFIDDPLVLLLLLNRSLQLATLLLYAFV